MAHGNLRDLSGERFGALEVVELAERQDKKVPVRWVCRCDCGQTVEALANSLTRGLKKACGIGGHHWRPKRGVGG